MYNANVQNIYSRSLTYSPLENEKKSRWICEKAFKDFCHTTMCTQTFKYQLTLP